MHTHHGDQGKGGKARIKQEKRAEALRDNLRKRKEKAKAGAGGKPAKPVGKD